MKSNSFLRPVYAHFQILMHSHSLFLRYTYGDKRITGDNIFSNFKANIFSTRVTNFEILILVLMPFLPILSEKTQIAYLPRKVTEELKWSQNKTKFIYQIQFCGRMIKIRSLWTLEWMFSKTQFLKGFKDFEKRIS